MNEEYERRLARCWKRYKPRQGSVYRDVYRYVSQAGSCTVLDMMRERAMVHSEEVIRRALKAMEQEQLVASFGRRGNTWWRTVDLSTNTQGQP